MKKWVEDALSGIEQTSKILAKMEFDPQGAHGLLCDVFHQKQQLQDLEVLPPGLEKFTGAEK